MSEESASIKNNSDKGLGKKAKVFAAFLAVALIAGVSWILISKSRAETGGQAPAAPAVKEVVHLEGFVVNLADPSGDCFLRVGVDLGLGHAIDRRGEKDNGAIPTAQVRDVVLRILTTYRSDDLLAPEGKIRLKQQLVQSLQAAVPELGIREVYFTDFLVQR
jgi:flagellar FliL protein